MNDPERGLWLRADERAQSITLGYTLTLGISLILVTGLLIAGAGFVDNQRQQAARTELRVIGQQVAADISTTDRLAQSTASNSKVKLRRALPPNVAGSSYTVQLAARENPRLYLSTDGGPPVNITIHLVNETELQTSAVDGGKVEINHTDEGIRLQRGGDEE